MGSSSKEDTASLFTEGERVLAYYGPSLYGAKVHKVERCEQKWEYLVHYLGWNKNWDEWMSSKKTKGKQKITLKKIENEESRLVTQSKRRNGIYAMRSELSILCGAEIGFLGYSVSGKPYTFGSTSFTNVAQQFLRRDQFLRGEGSSSSFSLQFLQSVVDAHQKEKIKEVCEEYNSVMEEKHAEEEKEKNMDALQVVEDAWWRVDPKEVNDQEEMKQMLEKHQEIYEKLVDVATAKIQRREMP